MYMQGHEAAQRPLLSAPADTIWQLLCDVLESTVSLFGLHVRVGPPEQESSHSREGR